MIILGKQSNKTQFISTGLKDKAEKVSQAHLK